MNATFTVGQRVRLTADSEIEPSAEGEIYKIYSPGTPATTIYCIKFDDASINDENGETFMPGEIEAIEEKEEKQDAPAAAGAAEHLQAALDAMREDDRQDGEMKVIGSLQDLGYLTRDIGFEVKFRGRSFLVTVQEGRR